MPIKWTAPEILSGNVAELSSQSDVYVQYAWVKCEVNMAGYWPSSFLLVYGPRRGQKVNKANIQPS